MMDAKVVTADEVKVQIETLRGPQGERGAQGPQGERGERGPQGIQGPAGARGEKGDRGERGEKGATGERGPQGLPGRDGADGRDGAAGARGPQGAQGLQGERGEPGPAGRDGVDGIQGFSPIVDLERLDDGVLITVQNKDGNKIARVYDGKAGKDGTDGKDAEDPGIFVVRVDVNMNTDKSEEEILEAFEAGKVCILVNVPFGWVYTCVGMADAMDGNGGSLPLFAYAYYSEYGKAHEMRAQVRGTRAKFSGYDNMFLPNPWELKFTGAVNAVYDGKEPVTVKIPEGGSSELFIVRLLSNNEADHTDEEIEAAAYAGKVCIAVGQYIGDVYTFRGMKAFNEDESKMAATFYAPISHNWLGQEGIYDFNYVQIVGNVWHQYILEDMRLPNPQKLVLTGAVNATYDGSEQVTVNIPAGGGSGGGLPTGGDPNMMLVTDADGNAKWEARTHWKEEGLIDVLPENTPMYSEDAGSFMIAEQFVQKPVVGNTYTVIWNGVAYECTAEMVDAGMGEAAICLGNNLVMGGEDNGIPFFILIFPDNTPAELTGGFAAMAVPIDGSTEATVRIQYDGVAYHKLDPGYLPIPMTGGAVDVLPETTIELGSGESGSDFAVMEPLAQQIEIGKQYKVSHNGVAYTCTAKEMDLSEGEGLMYTPALGNLSIIPGNESQESTEPFVFFQIPSEMYEDFGAYAYIVQTEEAHSVVISIQSIGGLKIDNSALDMDWVAKYDNVGETIVAETFGRGISISLPWVDTSFLVEGAKIIVYADNVRYDLTVVNYEGTIAAGNLGLVAPSAPGNGEPFYLSILGSGGLYFSWGMTGDMSVTHTVSVYLPGNSKRVANRKLPGEFFPEIRPFYVSVEHKDGAYVADKTFDEIQGAYNANRVVCCKLDLGGFEYVLHFSGQFSTEMFFFARRKGKDYEVSIDIDGTVTVTQ